MNKIFPMVLIAFLLIVPLAGANYCVGDTLVMEKNLSWDGTVYPVGKNLTCANGCDNFLGICIQPQDFMPMPLFILFEIIAFASLFITFFRHELIFPITSMIIFFMMAILSFISIGPTMGIGMMALNLGFGLLSFGLFIIRIMQGLKEDLLDRDREIMG